MSNLDSATIQVLLAGNTVYLETTEQKQGYVYYAPDGKAYMQHFEHGPLTGPWQFTEAGYSVVWDKIGEISWQLRHEDNKVVYYTPEGEKRAHVFKIVSGDVENLAA